MKNSKKIIRNMGLCHTDTNKHQIYMSRCLRRSLSRALARYKQEKTLIPAKQAKGLTHTQIVLKLWES